MKVINVGCLTRCNECDARCCKFIPIEITKLEHQQLLKIKPDLVCKEFATVFYIEPPCVFLSGDNQCSIYEHRPETCRDYPVCIKPENGNLALFFDEGCPHHITEAQICRKDLVDRIMAWIKFTFDLTSGNSVDLIQATQQEIYQYLKDFPNPYYQIGTWCHVMQYISVSQLGQVIAMARGLRPNNWMEIQPQILIDFGVI